MEFSFLDVSDWELAGLEQRGATEHPWLRDPADEQLHLWKPASGRRLDRREHWAEKIASELARLLGVPCADVELAERDGVIGCVSRNLQARGDDLQPGARLLAGLDPSFRPNVKGHAAYTVANIAIVLADVSPPDDVGAPHLENLTGFDVFTGYLVFDALLLNRDRHAGNWAVLQRRDGSRPDRLCPLYDNASGLAMSMGDARKSRLLDSRGVAAYAARECLARPFARRSGAAPDLYGVASTALALCSPGAREHWFGSVDSLSKDKAALVFDSMPGMSEVARRFTVELVDCTRRRLIDVAFR